MIQIIDLMNTPPEPNHIPPRVLLSVYAPNQRRMSTLRFPMGMTLTKWINEAITEKLDRSGAMEDRPFSPIIAAPPFNPMEERQRLLRLSRGRDYVGTYSLKYKGSTEYDHAEHVHKKMGDLSPGIEAILEDFCTESHAAMNTEEQGQILAAHVRRQRMQVDDLERQRIQAEKDKAEYEAAGDLPQVNPHAAAEAKFESVQKANRERMLAAAAEVLGETPLVNVASPAMEEPADFWGEEDAAYHKIKAKACKA